MSVDAALSDTSAESSEVVFCECLIQTKVEVEQGSVHFLGPRKCGADSVRCFRAWIF